MTTTNQMRKSLEQHDKAEYYDRKAESVGKGGISADDPDAIEKLTIKLEKAISDQSRMKAINKAIRKHAKKDNAIELVAADANISDGQAAKLLTPDFASRIGYPNYATTNNAANIRRMKKRISELEAMKANPLDDTLEEHDGFSVRNNTQENRVQIEFDGKPEKVVRDILKAYGFRWSPTNVVWQRQLNHAGIHAAQVVVKLLDKGEQS